MFNGMFGPMTLRRANNFLTVILVLLALYIMAWPLLPSLSWWLRFDAPLVSRITAPRIDLKQIPLENTLLIPTLGLREKIHEGKDISTVNRGVWRRPAASSPDHGSNTVLVGHRFTYGGQSVFYNLNKINQDEEIIVYWGDRPYTYRVFEISVVPPDAIEIEGDTKDSILTLYTCTPLLTAKDRLVVKARLL